MTVRATQGPKPIAWVTIEIHDCLLVGEQFRKTGWKWECDRFPAIAQTYDGNEHPHNAINMFLRRAADAES